MIANARMYSVDPGTAALWRSLLAAVIERSGLDIALVEHAPPAPLSDLWARSDQAAVFMCGLPFSRAEPQPELIAAPVPSPADFQGLPQYWSEMVVRRDRGWRHMEHSFGGRIALTVPDSQSGCVAALRCLSTAAGTFPLFQEVVAPRVTPLGALCAVVDGEADIAPVDAYAFCLLRKYRPDLTDQVHSVARTARTPIPPLVASSGGLDALRQAFLEAHRTPAVRPLMAALLLEKFVHPDPRSYDALRRDFDLTRQFWREHALAQTIHPAFR